VFALKEGVDTLNTRARTLFGNIKMGLEYILNQSGPLSMAPSQLGYGARFPSKRKPAAPRYGIARLLA
jgi:choline dehydrogenase